MKDYLDPPPIKDVSTSMKNIVILKSGLVLTEPIGVLVLTEEATEKLVGGLLADHEYRLEAAIEGDKLVAMSFSPLAIVAKKHAQP